MTRIPGSVVLFGGNGYVGTLILAELLRSTLWHIVLPVRPGHDRASLRERIAHTCGQLNGRIDPYFRQRVSIHSLPPREDPILPPADLLGRRVEKVINAAGNVSYFSEADLNEGNIEMTRRTLEFARRIGSPDYVYVSTAFSAGYRKGTIQEVLHDEPDADPTYYTKTKRLAERMVAESGLPYIIVRPSVLIGDSRTGFYTGKAYGLYQFLKSFSYFLTDRYYPEVHVVAPEHPFHLLHQNTFACEFVHILKALGTDRIVNMVSPEASLPTTRDLYEYFFSNVARPRKVFLYQRVKDVPLQQIPRRQRMFLLLTRVNAEIVGRRWSFARDTVAGLETGAADAGITTVGSTVQCVDVYVKGSSQCRSYAARYRSRFPSHTSFVPVQTR